MIKRKMKKTPIILLLLVIVSGVVLSCENSKTDVNKEKSSDSIGEIAAISIAKNQKLVAEYQNDYYFLESNDYDTIKSYHILMRTNRKTLVTDTIYSIESPNNQIRVHVVNDSNRLIIEDFAIENYVAYYCNMSDGTIKNIIPSQQRKIESWIDIENRQIRLIEKVVVFAASGGSPAEYAEIEDIYDFNGNIVKKGIEPTPQLRKGEYKFNGSTTIRQLGWTFNNSLIFKIDDQGNLSGSGNLILGTQLCTLKGKVKGRNIKIDAYYRGNVIATIDLTFKISQGKNVLSGIMKDDDYLMDVYLSGYKK